MTTSSTISTPPSEAKAPGRTRRRVDHYFWVRDADIARPLGLGVRFLCGRYGAPGTHSEDVIEVVGGLMPNSDKADCRKCVQALERAAWKANG